MWWDLVRAAKPMGLLRQANTSRPLGKCSPIPHRTLSDQVSWVCEAGSLSAQQAPEPDMAARQAAAADYGPALGTYFGPDERAHPSQPSPKCHRGANMADDAASPEGELSKSTATEETSSAAEPDSGGSETAEVAETEKAMDG